MTNPIQGNQNFTKVSNTVVSTVADDDALDNANVLVERVAKGITLPLQLNLIIILSIILYQLNQIPEVI